MAENALGLSWTYNGAWWFLLPYALITVGSAWWIGVIYCRRGWVTIVVCVLLAMLNILIYVSKDSLETATEIGWRVVLALMNMGYMMFMFTLGILAVKHQVIERMKVRLEGCKHFFLARRWWVVAAMYSKDDAGWFCFGRFGLCPTICIADRVIVGE